MRTHSNTDPFLTLPIFNEQIWSTRKNPNTTVSAYRRNIPGTNANKRHSVKCNAIKCARAVSKRTAISKDTMLYFAVHILLENLSYDMYIFNDKSLFTFIVMSPS